MKPSITGTSGMTLLEIMVVIVILGMIASLVGVSVLDQLDESKKKSTRVQIQNIASALDLYKLDFGQYPSTSEGLQALVNPGNNHKPYMKNIPKDEWNRDFVYISPGTHEGAGYDIESYGPDGQDGGGDDIESWNLDEN